MRPVPFDVWWFRLPRDMNAPYSLDPADRSGSGSDHDSAGGLLPDRLPDPEGADASAPGLAAFRAEVAGLAPEADVSGLTSWEDVKFLDARLNRLKRWHVEGLLCIGDAAHAMSPVGEWGSTSPCRTPSARRRCWPNRCGGEP